MLLVGLTEEVCKLAIARYRVRLDEVAVPRVCASWWTVVDAPRVVDAPYSLALVGVSAAAGFASIENIQYIVFKPKGLQAALLLCLHRAVMCVPGHIAATGYASCRLAKFVFSSPDRVPKSPSLTDYASFLWLPVVVHTIFNTEWRSLAKLPFYNKRGGVMTEVRVIGASTQS
ncbi:unnamed protein product [Vitrella brassicaformis CCMP3155]|uniref:Uncharacterized protein n=2 Tax=Vitrella brassicaformis TaxID=1169539 RepID=A0A0G4EZM7_VITBC|nr:unnamed protein product [Vitrella brassicaformis CCMP3155]|eukprot:CEM04464.1 unnamed protein product [Vitrella brassicaformis CCMP3155]